jgi:hypothetical protein
MTQKKILSLRNRLWAHKSRIKEERKSLNLKIHLNEKDERRKRFSEILTNRLSLEMLEEIQVEMFIEWPQKR